MSGHVTYEGILLTIPLGIGIITLMAGNPLGWIGIGIGILIAVTFVLKLKKEERKKNK